jgi:acyl transferase domain-containing protein
MLGELEVAASKLAPRTPRMALVSNLTGRVVKEGEISPGYWRRHARETVRFADSMRGLEEKGYEVFVELGPQPVLLGMGRGCVKDGYGSWMPSLRKGKDDWAQVLESLGGLYVGGVPIDWAGFDRDYDRRRVVLPTYPFQRRRYWVDGHTERRAALRASTPDYRQWLCDLEWQTAPQEARATFVPAGAWLLCGADSGDAPALADALRADGREVLLATPGPGFARTPGGFVLDPTQPDQVEQLIAEASRAGELAGIVHL